MPLVFYGLGGGHKHTHTHTHILSSMKVISRNQVYPGLRLVFSQFKNAGKYCNAVNFISNENMKGSRMKKNSSISSSEAMDAH